MLRLKLAHKQSYYIIDLRKGISLYKPKLFAPGKFSKSILTRINVEDNFLGDLSEMAGCGVLHWAPNLPRCTFRREFGC